MVDETISDSTEEAAPEETQETTEGEGAEPEKEESIFAAVERKEAAEKAPEGKEAPAEEKKAEEPTPPPPKHRFRVNERDVEVSTEELIQGYQLAETSRHRLQEAAEYTRAAKEVIDRVAKDPIRVAEQLLTGMLGSSTQAQEQLKQLVLKRAAEYLEEDMLPEEQRKVRTLERELEETRKRLDTEKKQREESGRRAAEQAALAQADVDIAKAFTDAGLEPTQENYDEVLRLMVRHIDAGMELTAAQAATKVKEKISSKTASLPKLSPEELEKLDPDLLRRVREYDLQRTRARQLQPSGGRNVPPGSPLQPTSPRRDGAKNPKRSWNDVFDTY